MKSRIIYMGFDTRPIEAISFAVARASIRRHLTQPIRIVGLVLNDLRNSGLYWRKHRKLTRDDGTTQFWDEVSDAPMATEFANSRFLVPHLAKTGWALFLDADMLARADLVRLFNLADESKAVMVVQHNYVPKNQLKMDGQMQTRYPRKNWSSLMLFNCDHPANKRLTVELVNETPGRDLHRFCWLADDEIGSLPEEWNWLAGHSPETIEPKLVHYTEGVPPIPGYESAPYADEWRGELWSWAR
jgi:hypothetical protein